MHRIRTGIRARTIGGVLAVLMVLAVLAGCASSFFKQPQVTLDGVQLGGLGLRGGTLLVNLRVVNPNGFALNANRLNYSLAINNSDELGDTVWVDFAEGVYDRPFSVASHETATVQIPVEFSYSGAGSAVGSILRTGTFGYRASGAVDVRTRLGTYTVPFKKLGTATLVGVK
jgi:LEA14-like dessication related protein